MSRKLIERVLYAVDQRLETIRALLKDQMDGKRIVCYGAGVRAKMITRFLKEYEIRIDGYYVDKEYREAWGGRSTLHLVDELENASFDYSVIIAFQNYKRAKTILNTNKFGKSIYYMDDLYDFFRLDYNYFLHHYYQFEKTYNWLSDELSKDVFVAFINTRITGDPEEIFQLRSGEDSQYDYKLLNLSEHEIFVDCGAYDGDSIKSFLRDTNHLYDKIYAFEPDRYNCKKIKETISIENLICMEKGVWEKEGVLHFSMGNTTASSFYPSENVLMSEYVEENGVTEDVEVVSIDEVLNGEKATWIKMDIEGSEYMALKGACQTIKKYKPKLAICVYHRIDDLITIPQYINSLFQEEGVYQFYIRHHSVSMAETVLYAIPK